jgi:hypothetical protein
LEEARIKSHLDVVVENFQIFRLVSRHIGNQAGKLTEGEKSDVELVVFEAVKGFLSHDFRDGFLAFIDLEHG